eukprot:SAG11_NODE_4351_length_1936_cov_23.129559_2_plen_138_part_00
MRAALLLPPLARVMLRHAQASCMFCTAQLKALAAAVVAAADDGDRRKRRRGNGAGPPPASKRNGSARQPIRRKAAAPKAGAGERDLHGTDASARGGGRNVKQLTALSATALSAAKVWQTSMAEIAISTAAEVSAVAG